MELIITLVVALSDKESKLRQWLIMRNQTAQSVSRMFATAN